MLQQFGYKLVRFFTNFLKRLLLKERSAKKLSLSFCIGLYISFSPFIFGHTAMVIMFTWLFSLNGAAVFAGALFNNPWTMIPFYSVGYFFGEFILSTLFGLNTIALNPSWMVFVNEPISRVTGIEGISLWSFLLGGNLLGVLVSAMLYPVLKRIFQRLSKQMYSGAQKVVGPSHENSCAEQKGVSRLRHSRPSRSRDCIDR